MEIKDTKIWNRQTKVSWLDQVKKDNPNFGDSEYFRNIEEGILAKSFAFPTDVKQEGHINKNNSENNDWKIGIKLQNENILNLKTKLNLVLENGIEYIHIVLPKNLSIDSFIQLFENIYLDMLVTRWSFPSEEIMLNCNELISQNFSNAHTLIQCSNTSKHNTFLLNQISNYAFPPFNSETWTNTLAQMLIDLSNNSKNPNNIVFEIYFTNDFLLNICSIRALKLVINKLWNIFDLQVKPYFEVNIDESALNQDVHSNIFKLAAMATSASISNVDFLVLPPCDNKSTKTDVQWLKTSIHTQHILKQESHLSKLWDPTAGAYFIEDLTEQIAAKLWIELQEKI